MQSKLSISFCLSARAIFVSMILAAIASVRGELIWESSVQEFERTPEDGAVEARYSFKNVGSTPVTIVRIDSSCGCTVAQTDKKTYLPGESGEITARFSFGNRKGVQRKVIDVRLADGTEKQLGLYSFHSRPSHRQTWASALASRRKRYPKDSPVDACKGGALADSLRQFLKSARYRGASPQDGSVRLHHDGRPGRYSRKTLHSCHD